MHPRHQPIASYTAEVEEEEGVEEVTRPPVPAVAPHQPPPSQKCSPRLQILRHLTDFLNITMSKESRKETLLVNIYVISVEYPHTPVAIVPSSSNSGRRETTVRCTLKRASYSRVMPSDPRREEAAAAVVEEVVVEDVEDRRPPRHRHIPPAQ